MTSVADLKVDVLDDAHRAERLDHPAQADSGHRQLRILFTAERPEDGPPGLLAAPDRAKKPERLASTAGRLGPAWTSIVPAVNVSPRPTVEAGLPR